MELTELVRRFEEAEESGVAARDEAKAARDYYNGNQLTEAEKEALRKSGQMPRVFNRIRRKVDWLQGLELQSRTDPKALPRTPKAEADANAATDALRFVAESTDWDNKRSSAWFDMLVDGVAAVEVVVGFTKKGKPRVMVNRYDGDRVFYDPYSADPHFEDATYYGAVIWSDMKPLIQQYPDKEAEIKASCNVTYSALGEFEDKPSWQVWADPARERVREVLMHWRDGNTWKWARFVRGGVLEEGESPFVDDEGDSICPMQLIGGYVDTNNQRYGVIRDMFGPQDEINMRRRKGVALLSERQTVGVKGAVGSVKRLKEELRKPDGHVEIDPEAWEAAVSKGLKPFEILNTNDMAMGNLQMLSEAKSEIDQMGANSGLAGKDEAGQSGRARQMKMQGGLIEIAPLTERMSNLTRRVFRLMWVAIRQSWTEETWVRVTDDEKNIRFVGMNRPVTLGEALDEAVKADPSKKPMVAQFMAANGIAGPQDPRLQQVVKVENNVAEMDVDILIEEAPDVVTLEGETFQAIVGLAGATQGAAVPPDMLVELAPNIKREQKDRMLERMKEREQANGQQGQQAAQLAQQGHQLQSQAQAAKAAKDMSQARKTDVETLERQIALNAAQAVPATGF